MTVQTHDSRPAFRVTGRGVLIGIILFFMSIITVDVIFASLAYRTFSGEAAKDPYEAGILFNRTLAQRRAETALGWRASYVQEANGLALTFSDSAGAPIDGLAVTGRLVRPATEAGARDVALTPAGKGAYRLSLAGVSGAWDLEATARSARGEVFEVSHRLVRP